MVCITPWVKHFLMRSPLATWGLVFHKHVLFWSGQQYDCRESIEIAKNKRRHDVSLSRKKSLLQTEKITNVFSLLMKKLLPSSTVHSGGHTSLLPLSSLQYRVNCKCPAHSHCHQLYYKVWQHAINRNAVTQDEIIIMHVTVRGSTQILFVTCHWLTNNFLYGYAWLSRGQISKHGGHKVITAVHTTRPLKLGLRLMPDCDYNNRPAKWGADFLIFSCNHIKSTVSWQAACHWSSSTVLDRIIQNTITAQCVHLCQASQLHRLVLDASTCSGVNYSTRTTLPTFSLTVWQCAQIVTLVRGHQYLLDHLASH